MKKTENLILDSAINNIDELPINTLSNKDITDKAEPKQKSKDTNMRYVVVRVSRENKITKDNEELGYKAGEVITYTEQDIEDILLKWLEKRKKMKYYFITHDEDPNNIHYHIVLEFHKNSSCKFSVIKNIFPYGFIEPTRYGVRASVQYLVHMNHPEKYQYSWDMVKTNAPAKLEAYKKMTTYGMDIRAKWVIDEIIAGRIKEYEITTKIEHDIYIKYESKIKRAFKYMNEKSITDVDRELQVYVLQGPPRVGKSTFCKCWAKLHNMSIGLSSGGKNAFDEYRGQDVFVLDDFDYNFASIDMMKTTLDPHNNSGIPARYHNMNFKNCKVVFICTNTPITKWYQTESMTDRDAFFKRISYVLDFGDISDDYVVSYTVNEIVYSGKDGFVQIGINMYHDFKTYELESVDGVEHTFDLKKYINPTADKDKKQAFLSALDAI